MKSWSVRDVCEALESWAPLDWAYPWDKAGLAVGDPGAFVTKVLVCLTVHRSVYDMARKIKADMVVSHHPLIWEPLASLRLDDAQTRLCLDFAGSGIACYSAHTNLDVAPAGVNHALANALGLSGLRPLFAVKHASQVKLVTFVPSSHLAAVRDAVAEAGAGRIGEYTHCSFSAPGTGTFLPGAQARPYSGKKGVVNEEPECRFEILAPKARLSAVVSALKSAHPYEEAAYDIMPVEGVDSRVSMGLRGELPRTMASKAFASYVCESLGLEHVRLAGSETKKVRRVAVLGGSGGGEIHSLPGDIDAFVTGDVKYHDALAAAQHGVVLIDAGHAGTERVIIPVLADYLREHCAGLKVSECREPEWFRPVGRSASVR